MTTARTTPIDGDNEIGDTRNDHEPLERIYIPESVFVSRSTTGLRTYGYKPHLYAKATSPARECTWHLR